MKINHLLKTFTNANLSLESVYEIVIKKGASDENTKTYKDFCGILIPIKGKALYKLMDRPYFLEVGTVFHAGPEMALSKYAGLDEEWTYYLIHYKVTGTSESKTYLENLHFDVKLSEVQQDHVLTLCRNMLNLYKQSNDNKKLKLKIYLYELVSILMDAKRENSLESEPQKIGYVKEYVQNNIDEILTVKQMAEQVSMPLKRFTYVFTKIVGISPKQYVNKVKLRKSEELLLRTEKSLIEIAMDIGYEDAFYFSRFFKKQTGHAPSEFRQLFGKS